MCKDHSPCRGKAALVTHIEALHAPKSVCSARMKYLERQAESFKTWLKSNNQNAEFIIERIEKDTWNILRKPVDEEFIWSRGESYDHEGNVEEDDMQMSLFNINNGKDDVHARCDEQENADFFETYNADQVAIRAARDENRSAEVEKVWVEWLSKIDAIYWDASSVRECYLPKPVWNKCLKARNSLNRQRKVGILSWTDWAMLSNWVNRLMGSSKRYDIPDAPEVDEDWSSEDVQLVFYTRD